MWINPTTFGACTVDYLKMSVLNIYWQDIYLNRKY